MLISRENWKSFFNRACILDTRGLLFFEFGVSLLVIQDLWSQWYYLRGPAVQSLSVCIPLAASFFGVLGFFFEKTRKVSVVSILVLLYLALIQNLTGMSEADNWLWMMGIAYLGIPMCRDADSIQSAWCAVFKATGFLVYVFAGLNKAVHPDWWTGRALSNIFTDPFLIYPPFGDLSAFPVICQALSLLTLFQRLVVPWGLWSKNPLIKKSAIIILALMHVSYLLSLRIGVFSWTGLLYLLPLWFTPRPQKEFQTKQRFVSFMPATLVFAYLLSVPSFYFLSSFSKEVRQKPFLSLVPIGFRFRWAMFATYAPTTKVKEAVWERGGSRDYFRRRFYLSFPATRIPGPYRVK